MGAVLGSMVKEGLRVDFEQRGQWKWRVRGLEAGGATMLSAAGPGELSLLTLQLCAALCCHVLVGPRGPPLLCFEASQSGPCPSGYRAVWLSVSMSPTWMTLGSS